MPELPEVETLRRGLSKLIIGKTIRSASHDWPKSFPNDPAQVEEFLVGSQIVELRRRAKVLIIDLSSTYSLIIHLKMTGQLVFIGSEQRFGAGHPSDSLIGELPDKSTRVALEFSDDSHLYFNDQRKFGWMRLMPTIEIEHLNFFKTLGPEPLASNFNDELFRIRLLKRPQSAIKAVLLDQTIIAGIGNIYADESLWGAKIHPATTVKMLSLSETKQLREQIIYVLKLSIQKGGSTDRNFVNEHGQRGSYMKFARVFRREGLPCPRCRTIIEKTRVAGRGTHFCPHCQVIRLSQPKKP